MFALSVSSKYFFLTFISIRPFFLFHGIMDKINSNTQQSLHILNRLASGINKNLAFDFKQIKQRKNAMNKAIIVS